MDNCWYQGKVIFDQNGIAVVIGKSATEWIPVAIIAPRTGLNSPGRKMIIASSLLEGSVHVSELEKVTMRLVNIATRLVELRVGGWNIRPELRWAANGNSWAWGPYNKQLSKHIHSADITDPLTDQLAYRFPNMIPKNTTKNTKILRRLLRELKELPDSPLLLMDPSASNSRLLSLKEWSADLKNDSYERLTLARYPQLPIKEILEIAEKARQEGNEDPLTAVEESVANAAKPPRRKWEKQKF